MQSLGGFARVEMLPKSTVLPAKSMQAGRVALVVTVRPVAVPNLPSLSETTGCSLIWSMVSVGLQPGVQPVIPAPSWSLASQIAN